MNKNLLKPLVIVVLTLATLPIRAAALRHTVKQLASKSGTAFRVGQKAIRGLSTAQNLLPRGSSNQKFISPSLYRLIIISTLGIIINQTNPAPLDQSKENAFTTMKNTIQTSKNLTDPSEQVKFIESYFERINATGEVNFLLAQENDSLTNFLSLIPREQREKYCLQILKKHFHSIHPLNLRRLLIDNLGYPLYNEWALRLLKEREHELTPDIQEALIENLSTKTQREFASYFLNRYFKKLSAETLIELILLLKEKEQKKWLFRLSQNRNHLPITFRIIPILSHAPREQQEKIALHLLKKYYYQQPYEEYALALLPLLPKQSQETWALAIIETQHPRFSIATFKKFIAFLSTDKQKIWLEKCKKRIEKKLGQHELVLQYLDIGDQKQSLSSNYLTSYAEENSLCIRTDKPNVTELLPDIMNYANEQQKKGNIVFFHGQRSEWMFIEHCFRKLSSIKTDSPTPENFVYLRFKEKSKLSRADVEKIRTQGITRLDHIYTVLFANLHPYANAYDSNSMHYVCSNYDQTKAHPFDLEKFLESTYKDLGLAEEFEQSKGTLKEIFTLYNEAIKDQGNNGRLLVISMPKPLAEKITYSTRPSPFAPQNPLIINKDKTTNTVKISEHYDQVPFDNEFCIILGPEMVEPELARAAGIEIKGFDPAIYWETEKAQKYQNALEELMAETKRLYVARKTQEKEQQSRETLMERFYS